MSFDIIMENQNVVKKQSCVIWIKAFLKALEKILKLDLILQIMN